MWLEGLAAQLQLLPQAGQALGVEEEEWAPGLMLGSRGAEHAPHGAQ